MLKSILNKYTFIISVIILIGIFLLSRLPYFLNSPVPNLSIFDTVEYYEVVMDMLSGNSKIDFSYIPIGFPLFLMIMGLISNTLIAAIIAQNIISLVAGIAIIYVIHKCYPKLSIWAALVFSLYFASDNTIYWDTTLFLDSFYTNLLLLFTAALILAIKKQSLPAAAIASFLAAYLLLVRSSAIFVIPLLLLVTVHFIINKYKIRLFVGLIVPFVTTLLLYSAYNYYSQGVFSFLSFGRLKYKHTFVKTKTNIPKQDSLFIDSIVQFLPDDNEFNLIRKSWDIKKTAKAYHDVRHGNELYIDSTSTLILRTILFKKLNIDSIIAIESPERTQEFERYKLEFYSRFGHDKFSLAALPQINKYRYMQFSAYFLNFTNKLDYYNYEYGWRYFWYFIGRGQTKPYRFHSIDTPPEGEMLDNNLRLFAFKELANPPVVNASDFDKVKAERNNSFSYKLYYKLNKYFFAPFSRNYVWLILFLLAFIASSYNYLSSKFTNTDNFILFTVCAVNIGSALIFTLFGAALDRYSFTTEFTYYAVVALLPAIINLDPQIAKLKQRFKF